jgi:hypothetical protein
MAEIRDLIEELQRYQDEASKEKHQLPGAMSLAWNHPGILAHQVKTQPHYERDMQRASFLNQAAAMRDRMVQEGRGVEFSDSVTPEFRAAIDRRGEQASPYWNRGVLAYGQPLRNGTDWMQSVASSNLNAGRMIAGVPGADEDFEKSADRMLLGIPGALMHGGTPHQKAWEAERAAEENRPIYDLSHVAEPTQKGSRLLPKMNGYELYANQGMTDGTQVANEMGVNGLPGRALGMSIDILTDPVTEIGTGIRALAGGNIGRAAGAFAAEAALPATFLGSSEYLNAQARKQAEQYAKSNPVR